MSAKLVQLVEAARDSVESVLVGEALTDRGNARRLAAVHGRSLAWVTEWQSWAHFDKGRWRWPANEKALALAQSISDAMLERRSAIPDDGGRAKFIREAGKLQQVKMARAALEAAKPDLLAHAADFDARPDLLNCPNGVLDLSTLSLRPHDPADRLTLMTAADFRADATLELWNKTLKKALPKDDVRDYMQKLAGVTLVGNLNLDQVLVLYGITRTMKGTIQGAIHSSLGDYAYTTGLDDLAQRERARPGAARPELVKLQGRRMVSIYETSRSLKLDAALLKTIAGSDPITARDIFSRAVTFTPQFTLWIASNYRPGLPADDGAVWERIREIPFDHQLAEADRKPEVRATLADPAQAGPAVLAWCVEGLRRFRKKRLEVPDAVRNATRDYRDEMDVLADFGSDRLVFGDGNQATPASIRSAYDAWNRSAGGDRVTAAELGAWLRSRGCIYKQEPDGMRRRLWYGVGIVHEES